MFLSSRAGQAFVVRFDDPNHECGRVEHIVSGREIDFRSLGQLMDFLRNTGSRTGRSAGKSFPAASSAAAKARPQGAE